MKPFPSIKSTPPYKHLSTKLAGRYLFKNSFIISTGSEDKKMNLMPVIMIPMTELAEIRVLDRMGLCWVTWGCLEGYGEQAKAPLTAS
jgi:hypothetical protein